MQDKSLDEFYKKMDDLMPNLIRESVKRGADEVTKGLITVPQMLILETLNKKEECIMSELAEALSITTSAATGLIDRMIRLNLVTRSRCEKDRRIVNVNITEKGKNTISGIIEERRRMIVDTFGKLSKEEREKYLEIMEKVYRILTQRESA